jgi:hypothetical protein
MKLVDPSHPFYAPLWRRVVIVAVALGWAIFEFVSGGPFWGILFGAIGLYCAWAFFVAFPGPDPDDRPGKGSDP